MRNILKPAARTASSRARRSVRGVAAVVASVALAAGLGSYPVDAQETSAETTTSATAETVASTTTTAETPTSAQASSEAPKPVVVEPNSVTVERDGDVDHITIRDTDDNPWDSGRKASDEYIWGVKRIGDGDITRIVKVVADGEELDPQYFGYVNGEGFDVIGIDEDAFWTIPPMKLEIEVETSDEGVYAIAEPYEVPTARELSETGYGRTDQASATVNPDGVGMARAATQDNSRINLSLNDKTYSNISGPNGDTAPRGTLKTSIGGQYAERNVYLTELVLTHNNTSARYSLSGPITIRKNGGTETCTVQPYQITELSRRSAANGGSVNSISVDLSGCESQIVVWQGSGDKIDVEFSGPATGNAQSDYTMELYGSYSKEETGSSGSNPSPTRPPSDTSNFFRCGPTVNRKAPRALTDDEKERGTTVYVVASEDRNSTRTWTELNQQIQTQSGFTPVGTSEWVYNAIAYNKNDNWIYGVSQLHDKNPTGCPAGHLLQINPETGEAFDIGKIEWDPAGKTAASQGLLPSTPWRSEGDLNFTNTGWLHTSVDGREKLFVANASTSGTRKVYPIDLPGRLTGPRVDSKGFLATSVSSPVYSEDHTVLFEDDRYAWGLISSAGVSNLGLQKGHTYLERYDNVLRITTRVDLSDLVTEGGRKMPVATTWGKAWTYGNGNLGFGTGGTGANQTAIQIRVVDPTSTFLTADNFELVSVVENAPRSYNTDGTSNAPMPIKDSDLVMEKIQITSANDSEFGVSYSDLVAANNGNDDHIYWALKVSNSSDAGPTSGFSVTDLLPDQFIGDSARTYELGAEVDSYSIRKDFPRPGATAIEFNGGPLKPGETKTYFLSAALAGDACGTNTASVRSNEFDSDLSNNSSSSRACPDGGEEQGVKLRLAKVDVSDLGTMPSAGDLLDGSRFAVEKLSEAGEIVGFLELESDSDGYLRLPADLKTLGIEGDALESGHYQLTELAAPRGYNLLSGPIRFSVNTNSDRENQITIEDGAAGFAGKFVFSDEPLEFLLAVGDSRQGNLPATGGVGVQLPILLGGALIAAGAYVGRRKVAA